MLILVVLEKMKNPTNLLDQKEVDSQAKDYPIIQYYLTKSLEALSSEFLCSQILWGEIPHPISFPLPIYHSLS